jgi:hypothetical protein
MLSGTNHGRPFRRTLFTVAFIGILLLAACGGGDETASTEPTPLANAVVSPTTSAAGTESLRPVTRTAPMTRQL